MSINDVIVDQIRYSNYVVEKRKEDEKRQKEAEEQKKAEVAEIQRKIAENEFNFLKEKIENSNIRQILEIISLGLNSNNKNFSLLKERIIKMVQDNPHNTIGRNAKFFVSRPYSFNGYSDYYINFYFSYQGYEPEIFRVHYNDNLKRFCFTMDLFQHIKRHEFTSEEKESMAKEIINLLMID